VAAVGGLTGWTGCGAVSLRSGLRQEIAMNQQSLSLRSVVRASEHQVSSDLSGETVILDLKQSVYHGLDETGAFIWNHVQQGKTVEQIRDAMLAEFDVEPARCEQDLLNLLNELATSGLIEIGDEQAA
jgi:hypothetical protein